ncbi:hypothetical protein VOLCADRAFT_98310 [Volvox carteri f. nagariensis]|uniref:Uncharacterized protein n=1 Tax=Volvox carteri f. nagariensis TaxID=3068 RepID=D8UEW2_VOLCA|nr:uncharacterized protein VOLCADRAFT_98310 [Volvox carteri f. nagariensis]EFJ41753.1 hypothetical protein VOLCADRAFT_98310 [Volvox carteri f. nagariensis]|eukprot:XP_002957255.1 hypothetical protein VOLCADRAFT_98310 [Volvox carteri f. nagariensis]
MLDERVDSSSPAVTAILEYLFSKRRIAFLPICEPVPPGGLGLFESKIGGLPYLLPSESWPCNDDASLTHLWQLRVSELPAAVQHALGYSRGLMQVFLTDSIYAEDGTWYLVRVLDEGQLVYRDASEIVAPPHVDVLAERRITSYRFTYDFPHVDDAFESMPQGLDRDLAMDVLDVLQDRKLYDTVEGNKLLGWPRWFQGAEWRLTEGGEAYMQLVQIEDSVVPFQVGPQGTLLLQRHPTDRHRSTEDRSR